MSTDHPSLAKCGSDARSAFDALVEMYEARLSALEADVTRLEIENASLWAAVHAKQDEAALVASVEDARGQEDEAAQ